MKKLLNRLSTLYPRRWRERYGVEFGHLLDDLQPRWTDLLDVLGGAAMMQFRAWSGYLKLMGAMAAVGVLLAVALSFAWPSRYQASAVIQAAGSSDHWLDAVSRTSLSEIIRRPNLDLYQGQRQREPLEDVIEGMRKDVHIERQGPSNLRITFLYGDAHKAQAVVDALAIKMTGRDYTGLPVVPIAPDRLRFSAWGFCAGLVLGIAAGLIRARRTRQALFVAAWGLAGCLIAASLSLLIPNRYTSSATLRVIPATDTRLAARKSEVLSDASLADIMHQRGLETDIATLRRNIGIESPSQGEISISFTYSDRFKTQAVVAALVDKLLLSELNESQLMALQPGNIFRSEAWRQLRASGKSMEPLDAASLPESPVAPNRGMLAGVGLMAGLCLGVYALRSRNRGDRGITLHGSVDLA